jgi:hypothetical protein
MKETRPGTGSTTADLAGATSTGSGGVPGKTTQVQMLEGGSPKPGGGDSDKAVGKTTATGATGDEPPKAKASTPEPLAADELVLSRDATYAKDSFLGWFRDQVKAKVGAWGIGFDVATVHLATDGTTPVVALRWDAAWGDHPLTREIGLGMEAIDAKASVAAVQKLKGWSQVDAGDQSILLNLLGGETNKLSAAARDHLRGMFAGLGAKPDADQAKALKGVIGAKDAAPSVVDEPVSAAAIGFDLTGPVAKKDYAFKGKTADAEQWKATFKDAVSVDIVAPKAPQAGYHNHSVQQAVDAASYLPKSARAVITTILLNVAVNPDDAYWAVQYKQPGFHSYMTAGAAGVVTIYPDTTAPPGDNYMRGTMIHETGHTWSYKTWGEDKTKGKWLDWKTAMDKDKVSVSGYAMASIAEDVAETIQVYVSAKTTPKYEEYKKMVPNRFAILIAEYK